MDTLSPKQDILERLQGHRDTVTDEIDRLNSELAGLDQAIAALEGDVAGPSAPDPAPRRSSNPPSRREPAKQREPRPPRQPGSDPRGNKGIRKRIEALFDEPELVLTPEQIGRLVGTSTGAVSQHLTEMVRKGTIKRVGRGEYQLPTGSRPDVSQAVPLETLPPMETVPFTHDRARAGAGGGMEAS